MESVGEYQYSRSDIIGHGAFAVVFRGSSRAVSITPVFIRTDIRLNLPNLTLKFNVNKRS